MHVDDCFFLPNASRHRRRVLLYHRWHNKHEGCIPVAAPTNVHYLRQSCNYHGNTKCLLKVPAILIYGKT